MISGQSFCAAACSGVSRKRPFCTLAPMKNRSFCDQINKNRTKGEKTWPKHAKIHQRPHLHLEVSVYTGAVGRHRQCREVFLDGGCRNLHLLPTRLETLYMLPYLKPQHIYVYIFVKSAINAIHSNQWIFMVRLKQNYSITFARCLVNGRRLARFCLWFCSMFQKHLCTTETSCRAGVKQRGHTVNGCGFYLPCTRTC